jgi:hypothetical protein
MSFCLLLSLHKFLMSGTTVLFLYSFRILSMLTSCKLVQCLIPLYQSSSILSVFYPNFPQDLTQPLLPNWYCYFNHVNNISSLLLSYNYIWKKTSILPNIPIITRHNIRNTCLIISIMITLEPLVGTSGYSGSVLSHFHFTFILELTPEPSPVFTTIHKSVW